MILTAASFAALTWAMGPAVAVEVHTAEPTALRGWLGTRLLEEGYDLAPDSTSADVVVRVAPQSDGLAVEVAGVGARSFAVEAGPRSVQRLEVLHRALQGVEATAPATTSSRPGTAVAVQFSGPQHDGLLAAVANAAQTQGVAVRAVAAPDDNLVCIAMRGSLAEIAVGPAADGCGPADTVVAVATPQEQTRAAADLLARVAPPPATGEEVLLVEILGEDALVDAEPPPPSAVLVAEDDGELPPLHGPPRAEARLAAEGGIMLRGAPDAAMRGRARLGRLRGIGARIEVGVVPSRSPSLRVVDTFLMVGPDWQISLGRRVRLLFATLVGTDVHTYATDQRVAAEVGWSVSAPVGVSLAVRGNTRVHVMAHPGLSGVDTHHVFRNIPGWSRASWRVGVAVGFSYGWRIE